MQKETSSLDPRYLMQLWTAQRLCWKAASGMAGVTQGFLNCYRGIASEGKSSMSGRMEVSEEDKCI